MKIVYFARHGKAEANEKGLLAGAKTNSPLTQEGREHGHEISRALSGKVVELIVTSPLSRASDTAEIVAEDIGYDAEIVVNLLFTERDFGSVTNLPKAEAFAALDSGTVADAESVEAFGERAGQALAWLRERSEDNILVVSHAAFGQMLGTIAMGGKPEDFLNFDNLNNGGIYEFRLE